MTESKRVMEWQAQARKEGREVGELVGQIRAYQEALNRPISPREELLEQTRDDLARMAGQLKGQIVSRTNGHS